MTKPLQALSAPLLLCSILLTPLLARSQEQGAWRATSSNARSITGDAMLSGEKLSLNFNTFPIARVRALQPSELTALFDADPASNGSGSLYRLDIPATRKFLHHNTLCGSDDTLWMVTFASGRSLQLAFFSSQAPPTLTPEAIANSTDLCGTFSYAK